MIQTNGQAKEIEKLLQNRLSTKRILHCRETALLARSLCTRFEVDEEKGFLAGFLHDIARELDHREIRTLAQLDGFGITSWEDEHPILLHGRAGATIIQNEFEIQDDAILNSVRFHTCGRQGMGTIEAIIYVADFLEPTRAFNDGRERKSVLASSLLEMMIYVTEHKFQFLYRKCRRITEPAEKLYNDLKERRKKLDS
jgi:predicted HD superfamily hydrolase involved in NAD metabolism